MRDYSENKTRVGQKCEQLMIFCGDWGLKEKVKYDKIKWHFPQEGKTRSDCELTQYWRVFENDFRTICLHKRTDCRYAENDWME